MPCTRNLVATREVFPEDKMLRSRSSNEKRDDWIEAEHREAADLHVKLLEFRDEKVSDDLRRIAEGKKADAPVSKMEVQDLCAKIRECGGASYTAGLVMGHPLSLDASDIHHWTLLHELNDREGAS